MQQPTVQNVTQSPAREVYWDLAKALLIFLVIWGHCIQFIEIPCGGFKVYVWQSTVFKAIYLFHMPLFMCISGYFAAASIRKRGSAILPRYGCRLLIPCLTYALLHSAVICFYGTSPVCFWHEISHLWFLLVVFECTCTYYLFRNCTGIIRLSALLILPLLGVMALDAAVPNLFPVGPQFTYLWPFFLLGALLNRYGFTAADISKKYTVLLLLLIPLALYVPYELFVYNSPLQFSLSSLTYDIARSVIAVISGIGVLGLVQWIRWVGRYTIVQNIGKATLALYVLQTFFFVACKMFLPCGILEMPGICTFALSLVILLLLFALYTLLRRIPYLPFFLFGEHH